MDKPRQVMPGVDILPAYFPIPGAGFLPVNARETRRVTGIRMR